VEHQHKFIPWFQVPYFSSYAKKILYERVQFSRIRFYNRVEFCFA